MKPHPRRHLRAVPSREIHALDCTCPTCEPYAPSLPRLVQAATQTWALLMIGMIAGTLLVFAIAGVRPTIGALLGS